LAGLGKYHLPNLHYLIGEYPRISYNNNEWINYGWIVVSNIIYCNMLQSAASAYLQV